MAVYSGTVAAAPEAFLNGVPSISVSYDWDVQDLPTDVTNHKGYKLTKQGKSISKLGWRQAKASKENVTPTAISAEHMLFQKEVGLLFFVWSLRGAKVDDDDETEEKSLKEGYITVTPLGAISRADAIDRFLTSRKWKSGSFSLATILVTNDDGIDAPGLRALVQALVSSSHYVVQVSAPDMYVVPA
ncbi:Survival protein SurE-like phosphatase/nucleotidase [Trema orientale]|uniref:Survival protein SurE-like phosphatase/nucleotidase n=1 Tax=Trema orientale TaxID=63057 RepID=A0A2P5FWK4_TREOI|nr:Survival protein SurE-like phosphatase/nucleotidase [Trema orientale]